MKIRSLILVLSLMLSATRAADIVTGNVTSTLGPDFFFDTAATGGTNNDSVVFIRDYNGVQAGAWNPGATLTLKGLGWASKLGSEWVGPTYATATFIDLGPNGVLGGGDDVTLGTVTDNLVINLSSGSEYVWAFDIDITGTMTGQILRIQIEGFDGSDNPAAISRKTNSNTDTSQAAVKLSLAATASGGTVASTYTASSGGFWDTLVWSKSGGGTTGGDLGNDDTVFIGDDDIVVYRGVPATETVSTVLLGEDSATGQARMEIESGNFTVSTLLEVGRSDSLNDSFLEVSGGSLTVNGPAVFGRDAEGCDGSLIVSGGTVTFGSDLRMGGFTEGGSMLRFHNPGSSPAVQVGGTLLLERVALDFTFDGNYTHIPDTVIPLLEYTTRDGQFGNFRNGQSFTAGPNRFRIDYDVPSGDNLAITITALPNWTTASTPPNIVFIFSDDQGYADLSTNEHPDYADLYPMPELDSLASQGVRFTSAYVSAGVCHPSRVGLLTGRHQQRFGAENNWIPGDPIYDGLPLSQPTVPRRLQALGYRTYGIGKWHLGETVEFHPNVRGFDRWYGMWGGSRSFYEATIERQVFQDQMTPDYAGETGQYMTDRIGDKTVAFIDEHLASHAGQPFYIYMSFTAVHAPMDIVSADSRFDRLQNEFGLTASDYVESTNPFGASQSTVNQNRFDLAAMTLALDENIGKVVDKIAAEGLSNNTIFLYMTDNGGAGWKPVWGGNYSYNYPLKGWKGDSSDEGSVRVPATLTWPATIPAGQTLADPVTSLDFMASFLNAVSAPAAARNGLDGIDILPRILTGDPLPNDRVFSFRMSGVHEGGTALRKGDWKLYIDDTTGSTRLYNLTTDIGESTDVSSANPEIVSELQARLSAWEARTLPPLYREGAMQLDTGLIRYPISGGLRLKNDSSTLRWISGDLRNGVSTATDFYFRSLLRATESTYQTDAALWYGLGDSSTRSTLIRFGIDFTNSQLRIVEGKTGGSASVPLSSLPTEFSELLVGYEAASTTLTVSLGDASASLVLTGSYGSIDTFAMGAQAMEGEVTVLAPLSAAVSLASQAIGPITVLPNGSYQFDLNFAQEPPSEPLLERSHNLVESFSVDEEALIEPLGGGLYRISTPAKPAEDSEFFRFRYP